MQSHRLTEQMLDPAQRLAHYFNGRLLSAEDLGLERTATRLAWRRLGQALGEGVVTGLEVTISSKQPAVVRVASGFALARDGTLLEVPAEVVSLEVELALPAKVAPMSSADGRFGNCTPLTSPGFTGQDGFYLLAISPTSGPQGLARVMGLPGESVRCNTRYEVPGVVFDLIQLNPAGLAPGGARLRSRLAAQCFGLPPVTLRGDNTGRADTLLDAIRPHLLPDGSAPLAVVHLTQTGLKFLDQWSARRRPAVANDPATWTPMLGGRRAAELEAMALQFAAQLEDVLAENGVNAATLEAQEAFAWLPPAGLLPATVDWRKFLGPHAPRAATALRGDLVRARFLEALTREPIAVANFADGSRRSDSPPVPVEVHLPEPDSGFVLFTRSASGRVRVFAEPADEFSQAGETFAVTLEANRGWNVGPLTSGGPVLQLDALPADSGRLHFSADGWLRPASQQVTIVDGRTTDVGVVFEPLPNGSLLVTVRDPSGQPAGARVSRVTATSAGGQPVQGLRLGDGTWQVPSLDEGSYALSVIAAGFREATASGLQVKRGLATRVVVDLVAVPHEPPPRCTKIKLMASERLAFRLCLLPSQTHLPRFVLDWPTDQVVTSKVKWPAPDFTHAQADDRFVEIQIEDESLREGAIEADAASESRPRQFLRMKQSEFGLARLQEKLKLRPAELSPWRGFTPLNLEEQVANATEVARWLANWRDELAASHPGYAIERAKPAIYVQATSVLSARRERAPEKPVAWAVFGSVGVPLVVTPEDEILPLDVPPEKVLPGRPGRFYDRLKELGIERADELPHLWTGLFIQVDDSDPAPDFAADTLDDARNTLVRVRDQRLYFPGVSAADMAGLQGTPLATDAGLANASVTEVAERLGGNVALARQIISNARAAVGRNAWSLGALGGLSNAGIGGLRAEGVTSLGQLAALAKTDAGKATLTRLGFGETEASELVGKAESNLGAATNAELVRSAVPALLDNAADAKVLLDAGFTSVAALADKKPAELAAATGLSNAAAKELIGRAKTFGSLRLR